MALTHYIFVRRDLPLGTVAAMVTHAAGESGALYMDALDGRFRGAHAVVLNARNEDALKKIVKDLLMHGIPSVAVFEPDPPYNGQLMAIGVVPRERDHEIFGAYQLLSALDIPSEDKVDLSIPNETNKNSQQAS